MVRPHLKEKKKTLCENAEPPEYISLCLFAFVGSKNKGKQTTGNLHY
jgi:hypothetical protein